MNLPIHTSVSAERCFGVFVAVAFVLAAGIVCSAACGAAGGIDHGPTPKPNFILVSIDTLRADHLTLYGYSRSTSPRLDELAESSIVFDRAYAHSANTIVSHASMLTSLYPVSHGARPPNVALDRSFTTLAEAFRSGGYRTAGFTAHPSWLSKKMGFAQGFDDFRARGLSAKRLNREIFDWLQSRKLQLPETPEIPDIEEKPFFLFVHYYDVHSDWRQLPYETRTPFDDRFVENYTGEFRGCRDGACGSEFLLRAFRDPTLLSQEELKWLVALYDGGIAYVDHQIGSLFDQLRELDCFDSSWIVVTSDHGEEFMEHGKVLHTQPYEETARVPFIIKPPGSRRGRLISDVVGLVDLMPTLLEAAGIDPETAAQGRSLLALIEGHDEESDYDTAVYFNELTDPGNVTIRHRNYTLVTRHDFRELELYHHAEDPEQKNNLIDAAAADVLHSLLDKVKGFSRLQQELRMGRDGEVVRQSEEEIERLRSLGYVFD